jgi:acyl-CoA synthetase (AMP-forming)/AMP-acid ligase II
MPIATLADIVRHHRTAHAESIALSFEGHDTSYALLDRRANQVSNGLARMGVRAGARVALLDKNNDSFFEIWFGATKANVVLVPINWRLAAPEITYIVNDAQAEVLFVGTDYLQTADRIRNQLKTVRRVIVTDRDFAAWRDRQSDADPELPIAGGDVCVQVYTSGTTGRPKGAQLTNDNLMTFAGAVEQRQMARMVDSRRQPSRHAAIPCRRLGVWVVRPLCRRAERAVARGRAAADS